MSESPQLRWYALQTRSNFERMVSADLGSKGIECFLPESMEMRRWSDRSQVVASPLFRGYVFVRIEATAENRIRVLRTTGSVRLLGSGRSIEPVPDEEIESIQRAAKNAALFAHPFLPDGVRVVVRRGPLVGVNGLLVRYKNRHRLVLSVDLLSKSAATEVDLCDVEVVSSSSPGMRRMKGPNQCIPT